MKDGNIYKQRCIELCIDTSLDRLIDTIDRLIYIYIYRDVLNCVLILVIDRLIDTIDR